MKKYLLNEIVVKNEDDLEVVQKTINLHADHGYLVAKYNVLAALSIGPPAGYPQRHILLFERKRGVETE